MAIKTCTGVTGRPYVHVEVRLSQSATITATGLDAPLVTNATGDITGAYSITLWANNDLTPNGTYYTVTEYLGTTDNTFTIQVPQTAGPFTMPSILVTAPTASPSPNHVSTLVVDTTAAVGSLTVTAGETGIDTAAAGVLEIGGDNATSVEIGPANVLVDASGNVAARSFTAGISPYTPNANPGQGHFTSLLVDQAAVFTAGAEVATYGPSNGSDDTAGLNAHLLARAGGSAILTTGQNYKISAPLVVYSSSTLDLNGATITLLTGSKCNMVKNPAAIAGGASRGVKDFVTSASSTTVTSATAAFVVGDNGKAISINEVGVGGARLDTTFTYVNATTGTLGVAATFAGTNAGSIGPRDHDITIKGGAFVRANGNGFNGDGGPESVQDLSSLFFRRVDRIHVQDYSFASTDGKYGVSFGDVTDYVATRINTPGYSDGVHVDGPAYRGEISNLIGTSGDDLVGITCNQGGPSAFPTYADVAGHVVGLLIDNCQPQGRSTLGGNIAVYGDTDTAGLYETRDVTIRRSGGNFNGSLRSIELSGGLKNTTVERCFGRVRLYTVYGQPSARAFTATRVIGHDMRFTASDTGIGVYVNGPCTVTDLTVDGMDIKNAATPLTFDPVYVDGGATVGVVTMRSISLVQAANPILTVTGASTVVTNAIFDACYRDGIDYSGGRLIDVSAAAVLNNLDLIGTIAKHCQWCINWGNTTGVAGILRVVGGSLEGSADLRVSSFALQVYSDGCTWSGNGFLLVSAGTIRSRCTNFLADVSLITQNAGDMAYNTNAAVSPYVVGPATSDGTSWHPMKGFMASGTAVLVAGTKVVTDTKITANSIIRLYMRTPGGTPGAVWVSALTAATSFAITSTNGGDTSTIYYEVESY